MRSPGYPASVYENRLAFAFRLQDCPGHFLNKEGNAVRALGNVLPDTIHIYQGPIEEDCADPEEMAELVRDVVVHEVGHYFGLDDETMEDIEQGE